MLESNSIIQELRNYFCDCPLLKQGKIGVDYLGAVATEYSINPEPCTPVIKQYTDGDTLRQYQFSFMSVEYYSSDAIENIENSGFYEKFAEWIEQQDDLGNLPEIPGIQSLEVLSSAYLFTADAKTARYMIQCRITYLNKGGSLKWKDL